MRGLSKRVIDAAPTAPAGRETVLWDHAIPGFGLRLHRSAKGGSYILRYRHGRGRRAPKRTLTIGRHGPLTVEQARAEAKRLLALIQQGHDPAAARSAAKKAATVRQLAGHFLEHVEAHRKASTLSEYRRLLDHVILPAMGSQRVMDVSRADAGRLHHSMRHTPTEANSALSVLSNVLNFAERVGERPDGSNPCRRIAKYPMRPVERMLSNAEMARLGDALATYPGSIYAIAAIRLLAMTGARKGEILGLQWGEVDFDRAELRLPDSKTGRKTVHLPAAALAVLSALPRIADNPYVIPGAKAGEHLVGLAAHWSRIRQTAGLSDVRLHDLRHSFASVAAAAGESLLIIGKMLGHTQASTTQRYAHLTSDPVAAAASSVGGRVAAALRGDDAATVVPLATGT